MIEYFKLFRRKGLKSVTFFITGRCNARCKMCFYWKNNENKKELSIEEIEKISKNLPNFFWLWISGGEPFLRQDIAEICEKFYKNNNVSNIQIPTNGLMPEVVLKKTKEILAKCPKANITIIFSIDGLEEEHDYIRGVKGIYKKVMTSMDLLKELKKSHKNLNIQSTITLTTYNQERIIEIYKDIRKKVNAVNVNIVRGDAREKLSKGVDLDKYYQLHKLILKDYKKYSIYPAPIRPFIYAKDAVMREIIISTYKNNKRYISCKAISGSLVLDETGNIFPCEMLPNKLGDLRKENYATLLKKNKKLNEWIKKECYCTHECSMTSSIIYSIRHYPRLLSYYFKYIFRRLL
ncbi:MAG: radical SAM protein [Candidatus Pacearchaeota archaeon]|jgi:MoaA/NifB/PqqE/SkfB family radical SAM enzyme